MTKLAVIVFAALAVSATLAGVTRTKYSKWDNSYNMDRFEMTKDMDLDKYLMQMRTLVRDLTERLQGTTLTTVDDHLIKILSWQRQVLLQHIDLTVEKLEREDFVEYPVLREVVGELREVMVTLRNIEVLDMHRLIRQLDISIVKVVDIMEKLVRWVDLHVGKTQGSLIYVVKDILVDFVTIIKNIDYQLRTFTTTENVSLLELSVKINDITKVLTKVLKDTSFEKMHLKFALRNFFYYLENMKVQILSLEHVDEEFAYVFEKMYKNLYDVILPFVKTTEYTATFDYDFKLLKLKLIDELKEVSENILTIVKRLEVGYKSDERVWLIVRILKTYLFTIDQFKTELIKDVDTYKYDTDRFSFGKKNLKDLDVDTYKWKNLKDFDVDSYKYDIDRLTYGKKNLKDLDTYKYDIDRFTFGKKNIRDLEYFKKGSYDVMMYNDRLNFEKLDSFQIVDLIERLVDTIDKVHFDNVIVKRSFINLIRVYVSNLEVVVEKLNKLTLQRFENTEMIAEVSVVLKKLIVYLDTIIEDERSIDIYEFKRELKVYLHKFVNVFEKLDMYLRVLDKTDDTYFVLKDLLVKFVTCTRDLNVRLFSLGKFVYDGQSHFDYDIQISTLLRDFIVNIKSLPIEKTFTKEMLMTRYSDFIRHIKMMIEKLETGIQYTSEREVNLFFEKIVSELRRIVDLLETEIVSLRIEDVYTFRATFVKRIEDTAIVMQKILWFSKNNYVDENTKTVLYDVLYNFAASLKYNQMKIYDVYYTTKFDKDMFELSNQIQIVTNNFLVYLKNIRFERDETRHLFFDLVKRMTRHLDIVYERLNTEVVRADELVEYWKVVDELKNVLTYLHSIVERDTLIVDYKLVSELNLVLQKTSMLFKKLAYGTQSGLKVYGNIDAVIRSVMLHYLDFIQHFQVESYKMTRNYHIGTTSSELILQIETVADRLQELLRFKMPFETTKDYTLVWHVRRLYNVMEHIIKRFDIEGGKSLYSDRFLTETVYKIKNIHSYLEKFLYRVDEISTEEVRINLGVVVNEIKKLFWTVQNDFLQYDKEVSVVVRDLIVDFLNEMQYLEVYTQYTLQFVRGGQSPLDIVNKIDFVAYRLFNLLQYTSVQSDLTVKQIVVMQVGELLDTIQNVINLLKTEIEINGTRNVVIVDIIDELTKITARLHKFHTLEEDVMVKDVMIEFRKYIEDIVVVMHKLGNFVNTKIEDTQSIHAHGVINGAFNHILTSLRNMYIQLDMTKRFGLHFRDTTELINQIQLFTNSLTKTLEYVDLKDGHLKQAFVIDTLKFAHHVRIVADTLDMLIKYRNVDIEVVKKVVLNLRQIIISLQQVGTTVTTTSTEVLRNWLNTQILAINAEIQKLVLVDSGFHKDIYSVFVRNILINYLAGVQDLKVHIDNIVMVDHKGMDIHQMTIYLDDIVGDLVHIFRHFDLTDSLVRQTILVEYRKLIESFDVIVNKLLSSLKMEESNIRFMNFFEELKTVRVFLHKFAVVENYNEVPELLVNLEMFLTRSAFILKKLTLYVSKEVEGIRFRNTELVDVFRTVLKDYLYVLETAEIQFLNVLQDKYVKHYAREYTYGREYGRFDDLKMLDTKYDTKNFFGIYEARPVWQLIAEIKKIVREFNTFTGEFGYTEKQEKLHLLKTEIRKVVYIVESLITKLRMHVSEIEGDAAYIENIVDTLETALMRFKRMMVYNTFVSFDKIMSEFHSFLYNVVEQFDKLTRIQWVRFEVVLSKILEDFLVTLKGIKYQFRLSGDVIPRFGDEMKYDEDRFYNTKKYGFLNGDRYNKMMTMDKKYGYEYGMDYDNMRFDENDVEMLMREIKVWTDKVVKNMLTISYGKQNKQMLIFHVRELVKLIDEITERLQLVFNKDLHKDIAYEMIENLTVMKKDLFKFVYTGMITTDYQIKNQLGFTIRKLGDYLVQIWRLTLNKNYNYEYVYGRDFDINVNEIFTKYLHFLRNLYSKLYNGVSRTDDMSYDLRTSFFGKREFYGDNLRYDVLRVREFTRDLKYIIDKIQTKLYVVRENDDLVVRQVLLKLKMLLEYFGEEQFSTELKTFDLYKIVRELSFDIKNWMNTVEMYNNEWYTLVKDISYTFDRTVQKFFGGDKKVFSFNY